MTSWVDQFQTVSSGYTVFLSFQMYVYIVVILICEYFINFNHVASYTSVFKCR